MVALETNARWHSISTQISWVGGSISDGTGQCNFLGQRAKLYTPSTPNIDIIQWHTN